MENNFRPLLPYKKEAFEDGHGVDITRFLNNKINDLHFLIVLNGRVCVQFNCAAAEKFGLKTNEYYELNCDFVNTYFREVDCHIVKNGLEKLQYCQNDIGAGYHFRNPDGQWNWIYITAWVVEHNLKRKPTMIRGTIINIGLPILKIENLQAMLVENFRIINEPILSKLNSRHLEIIIHMSKGLTSGQIGEKMFLAKNTIRSIRQSIFDILGVHTVAEVTRFAVNCGLE